MNDTLGNHVVEVRVSEATRAMARDNSYSTMGLGELRVERDAIVARRRQIDARLAAINHRIRGNRLPPAEYEALGHEQTALKTEIASLDTKILQLKRIIHEMSQSEHGYAALWDRVRNMEASLGAMNAKLDKILEHLGLKPG